ncbi:Acyl-coenzyme A synthetase ACSM2A, mitochondrial [Manis javanica]|nr:Acyl-coenzyme A synthetase ACSM2A, mitochondrial [Manis javanica]
MRRLLHHGRRASAIDADGFLQLVDRAKDVIKSGGEWISSIDGENAAMGHPGVAEAAIIGVAHPKWQSSRCCWWSRAGHSVSRESMLDFLSTRIAKWGCPTTCCRWPSCRTRPPASC